MEIVRRTKIEQIKRIISADTASSVTVTRPTRNQKDSAGEHGTMSVTWAGDVSAGLQKSCGEILS